MPPEVGNADTNSDMHSPMIRMNTEISGQPIEIAIGPPLFQACPKVVKQPARMEMIENEMAKFEKPDQLRLSSCLYPSSARRRSSSLRWDRSATEGSFLRFNKGGQGMVDRHRSTAAPYFPGHRASIVLHPDAGGVRISRPAAPPPSVRQGPVRRIPRPPGGTFPSPMTRSRSRVR